MLLSVKSALVRDRHRSREFVEFLQPSPQRCLFYPAHSKIKLILSIAIPRQLMVL
jgi:hypothetical protein